MRTRGATLTEVLVVVLILVLFGLPLLIPVLREKEAVARAGTCLGNLGRIGKAMIAYTQDNNGFHPFAWGPANGACSKAPGSADACDAATSLGCLYPAYISTPKLFRCPSTEDEPSFVVNTPAGVLSPAAQDDLWKNRNWTLQGSRPGRASSYGYDPRIQPGAVGNMAIVGDWDGSWQAHPKKSTQNHKRGQNILYVDGRVKLEASNYCSVDPVDNVFIEGGVSLPGTPTVYWNADTDAFLVNGSAVLTLSYEAYKALQQ